MVRTARKTHCDSTPHRLRFRWAGLQRVQGSSPAETHSAHVQARVYKQKGFADISFLSCPVFAKPERPVWCRAFRGCPARGSRGSTHADCTPPSRQRQGSRGSTGRGAGASCRMRRPHRQSAMARTRIGVSEALSWTCQRGVDGVRQQQGDPWSSLKGLAQLGWRCGGCGSRCLRTANSGISAPILESMHAALAARGASATVCAAIAEPLSPSGHTRARCSCSARPTARRPSQGAAGTAGVCGS